MNFKALYRVNVYFDMTKILHFIEENFRILQKEDVREIMVSRVISEHEHFHICTLSTVSPNLRCPTDIV